MTFPEIPNSKQAPHNLTMIPGPIEFSDSVLESMSTPSQAHTSPEFVQVFQSALKQLRQLFKSQDPKTQPLVISGSGSLGWDITGANFITKTEKVLVLSTGFFSDGFADCLRMYCDHVDVISAKAGETVPLESVVEQLKKVKYDMITITHVDTSSAVVSDVAGISEAVKSVSPETLIVVDGVCSVGVEDLEFDNWGLDYALTASQKAVGVPAGLSISYVSERALSKALSRETTVSYYCNLKKWVPVLQAYETGAGAYYATPPVQLIHALNQSLKEILANPLKERFDKHHQTSEKFKNGLQEFGLDLLAKRECSANGLTAIYFPAGIDGPKFLKGCYSRGVQMATGIFAGIKEKYFRVGHMGVSAIGEGRNDVEYTLHVIKESLKECGYSK